MAFCSSLMRWTDQRESPKDGRLRRETIIGGREVTEGNRGRSPSVHGAPRPEPEASGATNRRSFSSPRVACDRRGEKPSDAVAAHFRQIALRVLRQEEPLFDQPLDGFLIA